MIKIIESLEMCEVNRNRQKQEVEDMKNNVKSLLNKELEFYIINASDDPANARYIEGKKAEGTKAGLNVIVKKLEEDCTNEDVLEIIHHCNKNKIPVILQLPVFKHLNSDMLIRSINPDVDADCFSYYCLGNMLQDSNTKLLPATPKGVLNILKYNNVEIKGKTALVIGRSTHVGQSLANIFINEGATTIVANSRTTNLSELVKMSDIVVSCVGKTNLIKACDLKDDAVLIGVGFTYIGRKQILDFDLEEVVNDNRVSIVSNRINCTGKATIDALIDNVIELYKLNFTKLSI
jgi:methylenetetrahydrofolate dehydrogenase (NADP+)/methenyltetrahydrofolate cyclohydrolase